MNNNTLTRLSKSNSSPIQLCSLQASSSSTSTRQHAQHEHDAHKRTHSDINNHSSKFIHAVAILFSLLRYRQQATARQTALKRRALVRQRRTTYQPLHILTNTLAFSHTSTHSHSAPIIIFSRLCCSRSRSLFIIKALFTTEICACVLPNPLRATSRLQHHPTLPLLPSLCVCVCASLRFDTKQTHKKTTLVFWVCSWPITRASFILSVFWVLFLPHNQHANSYTHQHATPPNASHHS